jgi:hypothetical protein
VVESEDEVEVAESGNAEDGTNEVVEGVRTMSV